MTNINNFSSFLNENAQTNKAEVLIKAFIENKCTEDHPDTKLIDKAVKKLIDLCRAESVSLDTIDIQDGSCTTKYILIDPVTTSLEKNIGKIEVGKK